MSTAEPAPSRWPIRGGGGVPLASAHVPAPLGRSEDRPAGGRGRGRGSSPKADPGRGSREALALN